MEQTHLTYGVEIRVGRPSGDVKHKTSQLVRLNLASKPFKTLKRSGWLHVGRGT